MLGRLHDPKFVGWLALLWGCFGLAFLALSGALDFLGKGAIDKAQVIAVMIILGAVALLVGGFGLVSQRRWGGYVTLISAAVLLAVFVPAGSFLIKLSVPIFLAAVEGVFAGEWDMLATLALSTLPSLYIIMSGLLLVGGYYCRFAGDGEHRF